MPSRKNFTVNTHVPERDGNWDHLLQWFHLDKHLPEQQNAKKLEGTKNNFTLSQLGANYKPAAISGVGAN